MNGGTIYPHRPELRTKKFWYCPPCKAWVGCHAGTREPLGTLANARTRTARRRAHEAFDTLWQGKPALRNRAYGKLAQFLGTSKNKCHIGLFGWRDCERVLEFVEQMKGQ